MSNKATSLPDRLNLLKKSHSIQCAQLDLALETTIRDSKYSNNLMEMMRREETVKESNSQSAKQLTQKVDEALRNETKSFFVKVAQFNSKKWDQLAEKLRRERDQLKNELMAQVFTVDPTGIAMRIDSNPLDNHLHFNNANSNSNSNAQHSSDRIVTAEDIEKESERLDIDYYNNWYQYESHHLQEAFQSQLNKLDMEWRTHEQILKEEYEDKKAAITGHHSPTHHNSAAANSSNQEETQRWHSAEKQKTLIHTAPVFSPHLSNAATVRPQSASTRKSNATMLIEMEKMIGIIKHKCRHCCRRKLKRRDGCIDNKSD